jgi:hypothetical protein
MMEPAEARAGDRRSSRRQLPTYLSAAILQGGRGKVESPEAGLSTFPQHDLRVDTEFRKEGPAAAVPAPSLRRRL